MNPKAATEMPIINMSFRIFFSRPVGTLLSMEDIDVPTLMNAIMFDLPSTLLPNLHGSLCFRHVLSAYITPSQLQSYKHAEAHSSLVDNDSMETAKLSSH